MFQVVLPILAAGKGGNGFLGSREKVARPPAQTVGSDVRTPVESIGLPKTEVNSDPPLRLRSLRQAPFARRGRQARRSGS